MKRVKTGEGRICVVEGCGKKVARGKAVCVEHGRMRKGQRVSAAVQGMVDAALEAGRCEGGEAGVEDGQRGRRTCGQNEEEERKRELAEGFRRRVERGEYGELLDARMREVMAQAAARDGLEEEMGAARFVLMRLLVEEEDLGKQALGVSRIISATARVARARKAIGGEQEDTLTAFINERLREIREVDEERRREMEQGRLSEEKYLELRQGFVEGGWLEDGEEGVGGG